MGGPGLQASLAPAGLVHCINDQCLFDAASDSEQGHDGKTENGNQMQFPWQRPKKWESDWGWGELEKKKREEEEEPHRDLGFTHQ